MRKHQRLRTCVIGQDGASRQRTMRNWTVRLCMLAVLGFGLMGMAMVPAGHASAGLAATVATDALSLRADADTGSQILATMVEGDRVDVLYGPFNDGWYEVRFNGTDGYAYGGYLAIDGVDQWGGSGGGSDQDASAASGVTAERWIDVDRSSGAVTLYVGDVAQQTLWGVMGWEQSDDGFFATANGTYYVYAKNHDLTWTSWANAYISDWVGFDPDRFNGFHSYTLDANGNVVPGGDGPTGGCVALDSWSAEQVYAFADYGMRVEVHW